MNSPDRPLRSFAETARPAIRLHIEGREVEALSGDALVAMQGHARHLRDSEYRDGTRSRFCLMSACQDGWIDTTKPI